MKNTCPLEALPVAALLSWFQSNQRPLPWRGDHRTPYGIHISEIMLQQTRVEAVKGYYTRFLEALPDYAALAACPQDRLLKLWEGLGYYSRARNLQKCAAEVVERYGGALPADHAALLSLPGIGPYTAGAIASQAFGLPVPCVDGNVLRVLSRFTGDPRPVNTDEVKKDYAAALADVIPAEDPGAFNQALMELGATLCGPDKAPACEACPLRGGCIAHLEGRAAELPTRLPKTPRRIEEKTVFALLQNGRYLGHRRPDTGLLAGLWQLPEQPGRLTPAEAAAVLSAWGLRPVGELAFYTRKHVFTHVEWHMQVCHAAVEGPLPPELTALSPAEHPLPTAYRICLKEDHS